MSVYTFILWLFTVIIVGVLILFAMSSWDMYIDRKQRIRLAELALEAAKVASQHARDMHERMNAGPLDKYGAPRKTFIPPPPPMVDPLVSRPQRKQGFTARNWIALGILGALAAFFLWAGAQ